MNGKTCLVTGATHGIGLVTARALAAAGATVLVHGRDAELGAAVAADIARASGNSAVRFVRADFMHLDEVRDLAERLARLPRLDVLVNNAGLMDGVRRARRCTAEGYDATFGVNHLAPFLLTNLLLGKLTQSAPARVVVVASEAHRRARIDFGDLMNARVSFLRAYQRSKLANLLFVRALAARLRGSGVTVNAAHPGFVASELFRSCPPPLRLLLATLARPFMRSATRGARTSVYLATSPEVEGQSGGYYIDCRRVSPSAAARCDEAAARLWSESARLTALAHA
ncbi:MAG TPA: SDR family NAD(P)-dependent oxidoreductase [Steroidobacteraceae bacterium]|nr:SDR family NAD(P)-dependent oxidoreductase [Steroidobacteraceae bacterium]